MKPYRVLSFAAALGLLALVGPAAASGASVPLARQAVAPAAAAQTVQLTLIKVICPSYSVVPANQNQTIHDQTGGHAGELDTSYQTVLVNPATDIPKSCMRADGWQFQLYNSDASSTTVGSPLTTGTDGSGTGSVTITLDASELALAQTAGFPTGLWVAEMEQPSVATFGALRCNADILHGDNIENVRNLGTADQHIYCIAYNVAVAQSTPAPTPTPIPTPVVPTPFQSVQGATATPAATPTPFQSVQGETATPGGTPTPPPTATSDGSNNSSTPLGALLICLAFGGLGLMAVQAQRRTIRH
jgi:hypothetical protein